MHAVIMTGRRAGEMGDVFRPNIITVYRVILNMLLKKKWLGQPLCSEKKHPTCTQIRTCPCLPPSFSEELLSSASSSPLELAGVGEFSASVRPLFQCMKQITESIDFPFSSARSAGVQRKGRQVVDVVVLVVSAGVLRKERQVVLVLLLLIFLLFCFKKDGTSRKHM